VIVPFGDPGPCPVCDTPHTACVPPGYTGPLHITQLPARDAQQVPVQPPPALPAPTAVPVVSMRERRKQRMGG